MTIHELRLRVPDLESLIHIDKIKLFGWWLHTFNNSEWFTASAIATCYDQLSLEPPTAIGPFLKSLEQRKPKQLLKGTSGRYKLVYSVLHSLDTKYGQSNATVHVEKLLTDLPSKLANPKERSYLDETLICLRNKAFRAAVVMAWNLAYDHLCHWIIADSTRLAKFNVQVPKSYPKIGYPIVVTRDNFVDFKESHLLQIATSAAVINGNFNKILKEKLDRRNIAAHPSGVAILQSTAEEVIRDLIENIVLKLQ